MTSIHHLNCGYLQRDNGPKVGCHCTLILSEDEAVLVDTGIGTHDIERQEERIGTLLIEAAGFKFNLQDTAFIQLGAFRVRPSDLTHCVISHLDPDHIGGLSDFPHALVHVSKIEYNDFSNGHPRYRKPQMEHKPKVQTYDAFWMIGLDYQPADWKQSSAPMFTWFPFRATQEAIAASVFEPEMKKCFIQEMHTDSGLNLK